MGNDRSKPGELVQGTLDMLVLRTLARGRMHGYAVAEHIKQKSSNVLRVEEGALYPALHRLELRGMLSSKWGVSDHNRRARYYELTDAGRAHLCDQAQYWNRMSAAIASVMEGL